MKKITFFWWLLLIILLTAGSKGLQDSKFFYYAFDRKIYLNESTNKLIVRCYENIRASNKMVSIYSEIKDKPIEWRDDSTFIITVTPEEKEGLGVSF
jgi:hypothetical protein